MSNPLTTTDDTSTQILTYTPQISDTFAVWELNVNATTGSECATWKLRFAAKSVAGTTSLVGSVATIAEQKDAGATTWDITVDISANAVRVSVTGEAGKTITWAVQGPRSPRNLPMRPVPSWIEAT